MELLVLDTSVVLKWFNEESHSETALKVRDNFYKGLCGIVVPDLLLYEFSNALRYNPNYTPEDVNKAVESLFELQIDIVVPTIEILKDSANLAMNCDISVYDAVFAALAKSLGAVFVTADEKLHSRVKELKFVRFIADFK
ncbi:type II toxin-antitoxin system VapC family toxin [Candidatus Woesearchaeota archaeon]|nr:type II toxin-antitoxin system VapC family toxin [Candidatus Woesearchaeota archaeon]